MTPYLVALTLVGPWLTGVPVLRLLRDDAWRDETEWFLAPLVGFSLTTLVIQTGLSFDITVRHVAPAFWVVVALLWLAVLASRDRRAQLAKPPVGLLLLVSVVAGMQGFGLYSRGAQNYHGRAWHDQTVDIARAQFSIDHPLSTPISASRTEPYLAKALAMRSKRLGVPAVHAFSAVTGAADAQAFTGPSPCSGQCCCRAQQCTSRSGLDCHASSPMTKALAAGLMPGVTLIHLENFLSQTLVMPLLVACVSVLPAAVETGRWRNCLVAGLILAAGISIGPEYLGIFAGLLGSTFLPVLISSRSWQAAGTRLFRIAALAIGAALVMVPAATGIIGALSGASKKGANPSVFPWATSSEGSVACGLAIWFKQVAPYRSRY